MPLVSVILPTYNRPSLLDRSLTCIDRQTFKDYELIVVNDAGEDVSEIALKHQRVRYIAKMQNGGLAAARNTGIKAAKGKYIAYQDDDDLWFPEHLETLVNHLESLPNFRAAYTNCYRWYQEHYLIPGNEPKLPNIGKEARNIMAIISLMHDYRLIEEIGYFDESLREMEDWDFIFRLFDTAPVLHIPIYTTVYSKRGDPTQLSSDKERMDAAMQTIRERHNVKLLNTNREAL